METNREDWPEQEGDSPQEWEILEIPDNCEHNEPGEETSDSGHDWDSGDGWGDLESYTSDESEDEQSELWQEWERSRYPVQDDGWTVKEGAEPDMRKLSSVRSRNLFYYQFLCWLVDIIGASFFDFSQRELRDELNSQEWKEKNLQHEHYGRIMVMKDWNDPDGIELKYWPIMLYRARLYDEAYYYPPTAWDRGSWFSNTILGRADSLRNAVFDRHNIEDFVLMDVMQIPTILKDEKRAAQVEMVWKVVTQEPGVDDHTISEVHKMLDLDHKPCTTILQVHSRVLLLLERGCFNFGKEKNPKAIEHWNIAEDFELRFWSWKWSSGVPPLWNPESPAERFNLGGHHVKPVELTRAALSCAVELRNDVAHRSHLNEEMLCWYAQLAILLLVLFDERILAMEIEILVEVFLSKRSREEVLCRLFKYYDGREVLADPLGEFKRRDAVLTLCESMNGPEPGDGVPKAFGFVTSARSSSDSSSELTSNRTKISGSCASDMDGEQDHNVAQDEAQLERQLQREYEDRQELTSQAAQNFRVDNNRLGRLPIFQRRNHGSVGLDLPHEPNGAQEVFGDGFYDLFPWARGVDPFDENATPWEPAERYVENRADFKGLKPDDNAEVPPAIVFVNALISLELDDLDEDSQACPICLEKYREGERAEMPLQLPCAPNHVIGRECLLLWLTDVGDVVHHASCPICRTECVKEKRKHIGTDEGLRQRLRDVNYLLTGPNPLTLTQEGRDRWETVKSYVNAHLANAAEAKRQRKQRFMMFLQIELRTNPNFTTNITSEDDIEISQRVYSEALEDLERSGVFAEYLEAADDAHGNELEGEIAVRMAAAIPPRLLRLMEEVYEDHFEELEMESAELFDDNDVEDGESESETDSDDGAMEMGGMVRNSIWCESCQDWHLRPHQSVIDPAPNVPSNPGLTIEYLENSRMDRPTSAPVQVSTAGPDNYTLWCTSCGRIHPDGTEHWAGHHEDDVV